MTDTHTGHNRVDLAVTDHRRNLPLPLPPCITAFRYWLLLVGIAPGLLALPDVVAGPLPRQHLRPYPPRRSTPRRWEAVEHQAADLAARRGGAR